MVPKGMNAHEPSLTPGKFGPLPSGTSFFPSRSAPRQSSGMSSSPDETTLKGEFPSTLDSYHGFIESVLDRLKELGWQQRDIFGVHMALEESISNGIRHGNKLDPVKRVAVECRMGPQVFWASVCDEGQGFRPADVPDCCSPECLELPGGRGLALMNAYMTLVQYNERGNCVVLEKRLADHEVRSAAGG
jgi:serine/threonine-protein kinase RsbW